MVSLLVEIVGNLILFPNSKAASPWKRLFILYADDSPVIKNGLVFRAFMITDLEKNEAKKGLPSRQSLVGSY